MWAALAANGSWWWWWGNGEEKGAHVQKMRLTWRLLSHRWLRPDTVPVGAPGCPSSRSPEQRSGKWTSSVLSEGGNCEDALADGALTLPSRTAGNPGIQKPVQRRPLETLVFNTFRNLIVYYWFFQNHNVCLWTVPQHMGSAHLLLYYLILVSALEINSLWRHLGHSGLSDSFQVSDNIPSQVLAPPFEGHQHLHTILGMVCRCFPVFSTQVDYNRNEKWLFLQAVVTRRVNLLFSWDIFSWCKFHVQGCST